MEPLPPNDQLENAEQKEPCQTETFQQQQLQTSEQQCDLQLQQTICQSEEPLELCVDGVSAATTTANLKTQFTQSGEVLHTDMTGSESTKRLSEFAYISQPPTVDPTQILKAEHIVCAEHINVEGCCSSEVSEKYEDR
ncbi:unnamed protein product [Dibothriocephalus latus]|uniref:RRM domain-containing protein n=1 Tax=Dibothriocephalus latus TaxID=60516 RepID=A0A3P7NF93_DIBLA|nr:unnamed protein product [Dibothriocephalus latus]